MTTNKMWGGRFESGPAAIMREITPSIDFDKRLAGEDIAGSKAHARMLSLEGIITKADHDAILKGLEAVEKEIADGTFVYKRELEDIHLNIEARLIEIAGPAAGRLHTARSRNDQVVTDFRLWVREACARADQGLLALQRALLAQAGRHAATIMPGFTHMQPAQPVTFGHHCLAYVEMFARDRARFEDARKRMNECPLGAAALAGTSFPIDRDVTARALGFHGSHDKETFTYVGYNSRLDELQAAILRILLPELDGWCDGRRAAADAYLAAGLAEHVTVPVVPEGAIPAWHLYAVTHPRADALLRALADAGVEARGYYRVPLHRQAAMAPFVTGQPELPVTDALGAENVVLPISPLFGAEQAHEVVTAIARAAV